MAVIRNYKYILAKPSGEDIAQIHTLKGEKKLTWWVNGIDSAEIVVALTDPLASSISRGSRLKVYYQDTVTELPEDGNFIDVSERQSIGNTEDYTDASYTTQDGSTVGINEKQFIIGSDMDPALMEDYPGTYKIVFDGETTAAIATDASLATITAALEALPNIGAGNVSLMWLQISSIPFYDTLAYGYEIEFTNALGAQNLPMVTITDIDIDTVTLEDDSYSINNSVNQIQRIQIASSPGQSGYYTIQHGPYITDPIGWTASDADIKAELEALPSIGAGGISSVDLVHDSSNHLITVNFNEALDYRNFIIDDSGLSVPLRVEYAPTDASTRVAGGTSNEVQTVWLEYPTSGTFTLTFDGQTTGPINYDASTADVITALEALSNIGSGDVGVTRFVIAGKVGSYTVTFQGAMAGVNQPLMSISSSLSGGMDTPSVSEATAGGSATNETQEIKAFFTSTGYRPDPASLIRFNFDGENSDWIPFGSDSTEVLATLEAMTNIGSGNIQLRPGSDGIVKPAAAYRTHVEFIGALAGVDTGEQITIDFSAVTQEEGFVNYSWIQQEATSFSEVQYLRLVNSESVEAGTFTLTFDGETTAPITYDIISDTSAAVLAALEALPNIEPGDVIVEQDLFNGYNLRYIVYFGGAYEDVDVPQITIDPTGLEFEEPGVVASLVTEGDDGVFNEIQVLNLTGGVIATGTFEVIFNGNSTGDLAWNIGSSGLQSALEALPGVGSGNVSVTGSNIGTGYTVEFVGSLTGTPQNQMTVDYDAILTNTNWRFESDGDTATDGYWVINSLADTTGPIGWDASAEDVQEAIENLSDVGPGNVLVTGDNINNGYGAEFIGDFEGLSIASDFFTVDMTNLLIDGTAVTGDNILCFYGLLPAENIVEDADANELQLMYVSPMYMMTRRYNLGSEDDYFFDKSIDIIEALMFHQLVRADITGGDAPDRRDTFFFPDATKIGLIDSGTIEMNVVGSRQRVYDLIMDIANSEEGPEFKLEYIDGFKDDDGSRKMARMVMAYPHLGEDRHKVVIIYGDDIGNNCANVTRVYGRQSNLVQTRGLTKDGIRISAKNGNGSATYPTMEYVMEYPDVAVQNMVQRRNAFMYNEKKKFLGILDVHGLFPNGPLIFRDFKLGDDIRVIANKGRMHVNQMLHICSCEVVIDEGGNYITNIKTCDEQAEDDA